MREIKFRGKRIDNSEWVYGYLTKNRPNPRTSEPPYKLQTAIDHEEKGVMLTSLVDPVTVGQYIGIKDKYRNQVYEGDIIQTYFSFAPGDAGYGVSQKPFIVEWEHGRTAYRARKPSSDNRHLLDIVDFFDIQTNLYEIIGNIYDNPDMVIAYKQERTPV